MEIRPCCLQHNVFYRTQAHIRQFIHFQGYRPDYVSLRKRAKRVHIKPHKSSWDAKYLWVPETIQVFMNRLGDADVRRVGPKPNAYRQTELN